jgi:hypothetical protein
MTTTRRTFMRQVGVTLAGLLVSGCVPASQPGFRPSPSPAAYPTCYAPAAEGSLLRNRHRSTPGHWSALRACWLDLADRRLDAADSKGFGRALLGRHRDALAALAAAGALEPDVAGHIGVAFEEAMTHVQRKQATCCEPTPQGAANPYPPREEVVTRAAALAEMAGRSGIAAETVAIIQAALARDMAWLEQFRAGEHPGEVASLEATPAEIEAARVLVALLLETQ